MKRSEREDIEDAADPKLLSLYNHNRSWQYNRAGIIRFTERKTIQRVVKFSECGPFTRPSNDENGLMILFTDNTALATWVTADNCGECGAGNGFTWHNVSYTPMEQPK